MPRVQFVVSVPALTEEIKQCTLDGFDPKGHENLAFESKDEKLKSERKTSEEVLERIIRGVNVSNLVWTKHQKSVQVSFYVNTAVDYNAVLKALAEHRIGAKPNSFVNILPCSLFYQNDGSILSPKNKHILASKVKDGDQNDTAWDKFVQSVQPRIIVSQVLESVCHKATFTCDYLVLLLIAGLTAALGLVKNNTVILVASMLISPMMGPIIAGMFGTIIPDRKLQKIGVINGFLSLLLCVAVGFLFGACVDLTIAHKDDQWPTVEMLSRGELKSLWDGIMIAVLSGAAIAIAILSDITESVIGVAISAALLPPAVNAGLFWSMALVNVLYYKYDEFQAFHEPIWDHHPTNEYLALGAVSLCLTILNIIFIYFSGILVLRVKDVTTSEENISGWNRLQMAREYKPLTDEEANSLSAKFGENLTKDDLIKRKFNLPMFAMKSNYQNTWSPGMVEGTRPNLQDMVRVLNQSTLPRNLTLTPWTNGPAEPTSPSAVCETSSRIENTNRLPTIEEGKGNRFTVSPASIKHDETMNFN